MDLSRAVLHAGDAVTADGQVVAGAEGWWLAPTLPVPLGGPDSGARPPFGVPLRGGHLTSDARVRVEGEWQVEAVQVRRLLGLPPTPAPDLAPLLTRPPCPPPPGGWPTGDGPLPGPPEDLLASGAVSSLAVFRPAGTQPVVVVAAMDPAAVVAALTARYGDRLCLVRSHYSAEQIRATRRVLDDAAAVWGVYEAATSVGADGQPVVRAAVVRVLPELAAWVAAQPNGLVDVTPWLNRLG